MRRVPVPTPVNEELPAEELDNKKTPVETKVNEDKPEQTPKLEVVPDETPQNNEIPDASPEKTEKPSDVPEENCVVIGGNKIEIKPTKLKYFRNKAASAYGVIKAVPIHELLVYEKGVLDEKRDADQLLYDFLVAVFDDPVIVRDNYNEIDADTLEKIIKIFGRLNHIDEKQEALRKNKEAQAKP